MRTAQKDALIGGVGLFKGLDGVDLQEEGGAALNLRSDPKRNAKDVLGHRKTYVVVRVGEPPKPPREPTDEEAGEGEEPEPEAGPDPDALVPLGRSNFRQTPWSPSRSPPRSLLPRRGRAPCSRLRMPYTPTRYKYHTIPYPAAACAGALQIALLRLLLQDVAT